MIALLDVNVLVALFDPAHVHHEPAHDWFARHRARGWASCPLTENGLVRVLSSPSYPGRRTTVTDATRRLAAFRDGGNHEFWPDSLSILDASRIAAGKLSHPGQITDVYLLALAVEHRGALVTFDRSVPRDAVPLATESGLVILGK